MTNEQLACLLSSVRDLLALGIIEASDNGMFDELNELKSSLSQQIKALLGAEVSF